ncbi:MAG: FAD-binding oxidoreductase [candidate division Zixibacteria bacterium]|nr:FAD-binding oxidoreductase [candidate division Zixibacteria bacterium]
MSANPEIVVIGGGVIGLACAFYIARDVYDGHAAGKVIVLEREIVTGAGATGKNAGGIRAQFSSGVNIEFSQRSIEIFENFREETGQSLFFNQCGYLFLLSTQEQVDRFDRDAELQRSMGVEVDFLSPQEIRKLAPALRTDDIIRANFSRRDGVVDPGDLTLGYYNAAIKLGVKIVTDHNVTGFEMVGDVIKGVKTDKAEFPCETIVNAAGPQSKQIAKMAGYDLKVEPVRRQIVTTGPLDFVNREFPMVVDVNTGLYCHRETPGLLLGWADPATQPGNDESPDSDYTDEILMKGMERIPLLEDAEVGRSWAGLYDTTPDHNAIIGNAPGLNGMILVNGFSGHGLMHAPAAGMVVADLVMKRETRLDLSGLSPERFNKGALVHETNVI